ncbi:MAG: hypothetical protein PHP65_00925 [Bacilli bacterium]|jgi:hypothetical protein|nr:hypothetical protein [Bacilli bacterium]
MNKLLSKLKSKKMCLIASLPENSYELAKIAWEAGVDAIKVHINVSLHRASQNHFGSLDENKEIFKKIIADSPVPVGIVAGEQGFAAEAVVDEIVKMGFDFISLYGHHTPPTLVMREDINNFLALNSSYSFEEMRIIANSFVADILELSIVAPENYGERLSARELAKYEYIASISDKPAVVPTQKVIYPSDVIALYKTGVKAVMVGAISMGKEKESIKNTLQAFRNEIDKL